MDERQITAAHSGKHTFHCFFSGERRRGQAQKSNTFPISCVRAAEQNGERRAGNRKQEQWTLTWGGGGRQEVEKEVLETRGTSPPAPGGEEEARQGVLYHWGGGSWVPKFSAGSLTTLARITVSRIY